MLGTNSGLAQGRQSDNFAAGTGESIPIWTQIGQ